jgi:hypothetical protein
MLAQFCHEDGPTDGHDESNRRDNIKLVIKLIYFKLFMFIYRIYSDRIWRGEYIFKCGTILQLIIYLVYLKVVLCVYIYIYIYIYIISKIIWECS